MFDERRTLAAVPAGILRDVPSTQAGERSGVCVERTGFATQDERRAKTKGQGSYCRDEKSPYIAVWPHCQGTPVSWTARQFQACDAVDIPAGYFRCEHETNGWRCRQVRDIASYATRHCSEHGGERKKKSAPRKQRKSPHGEKRQQAEEMLARGMGLRPVARETGIPLGTVVWYAKKMAEAREDMELAW